MRRRILVVALSTVVLAVLLLGVPLAVAIQRNAVSEERGELERAALRAAAAVSPTYRGGDPVELPTAAAPIRLSLYDPRGRRVSGPGPEGVPATVTAARTSRVVDADGPDTVAVAVPVSVHERVIAVVVADSPTRSLHDTIARRFLELAGLGVLALLGAGAFASWQAQRLSRPMRELARAATAMGAGDFGVRVAPSGVPEIDETADALAATSGRLAAHIERERAFAAHASHQLRTPLTRLRLELENGLEGDRARLPDAARAALGTADHLAQTVDDVLALAREDGPGTPGFELESVLEEIADAWRGTFALEDRPLRLRMDARLSVAASEAAVRQVLQVLLDNSYRHGAGPVTVTARATHGAVAVDVVDGGTSPVPWPPRGAPDRRLGLPLAKSLAEAQGGRLVLDQAPSGTRFTLLVPGGPGSGEGF